MLEGLEINVVSLTELLTDNEKFRFDDEFFRKKYLQAYKTVKNRANVRFDSIIDTLTDFHANGSYESIAKVFSLLDEKNYAYMVRTTDLESQNFDTDVKYITEECYNYLSKSKLYGNELLINKIGTPGKAYIMPNLKYPCSLGMNMFMVRIKKDSGFNTHFLWAFLNTKLGENIIKRKVNGTVPLTIDKEAIKSLYIPILSEDFQNKISSLLITSDEKLSNAKQLYQEAEDILLSELGLNGWKPQQEAVSVKSFADFATSGRLDAEYYQPKYDDLFAHLKKYETKPLSQIATISKSIEPGSDAYQESGIPFVRVSNLSKYGLTEPNIHLDRVTYETAELKPKKDTILLSKDGSVGIAYKLEQDLDAITSGAILHLKITDKEFLPDYLTLVLNSIIVKMQAERDAGGSIIQHWKPSEIEQVIIPKLSGELQTQIAEKIQESFALKAESKRLLDLAKTAVETAIEHGEEKAIELLNN